MVIFGRNGGLLERGAAVLPRLQCYCIPMPDFLSPELQALRERALTLARGPLTTLLGKNELEPKARESQARAASKAAEIYSLTQDKNTSAMALLVAREALAMHGVTQLSGIFGAAPGLLANVEEPLRSTHLLPLLSGEKRTGFAFTEPANAPRPSWASVDGQTLVVTGQKSYVTGGADASFITALLEIEGEGPSMVVIDCDLPGVSITRRFESLDGSHHAAFQFDAVRVPRHHAIGAPGEGRTQAMQNISAVRRAVAAECLGSCIYILDLVANELQRDRKGIKKSDSERVRLRFGGMLIQAYAARSMVYRTARLADAGENVVNETIAAKVFASETANQIADMAIQLLGGEALVYGHPLEAQMRRLRGLRLAEGESDTLRANLSRGFLDLGKGRI